MSRIPGEPRLVLWLKLAFAVALFLVTFGLVDWTPKTYVHVIDRRTEAIVLEHSWHSPRWAEEDVLRLEEELATLSLEEFRDHHGIAG